MITRKPVDRGARMRVTFRQPAANGKIAVAGDFNDWDPKALVLRKRGDSYAASVELEPGRRYAFRYVAEDGRWFNDENSDDYESNGLGDTNSIIDLTRFD
jgi:1,4-alpha-glucan branching enzyme